MKACSILLIGLATLAANAQTNQPPTTAIPTNGVHAITNLPALTLAQEESKPETNSGPLSDEAFAAQIIRNAGETPVISTELKPNEITIGKFTFSGITIELVKMPNPLQVLNPFAPPEYGPGEINLARDPRGHPSGLRFFSIEF
jgi:hypothetical protein